MGAEEKGVGLDEGAMASPASVVKRIRSSKDLEGLKPKSSQGGIGMLSQAGPTAVAFTFVNALPNGANVRLNEVPRSATFKVPPPDDPDEDPLQDNDNDILKFVVPTAWADTGGSDYEGSFDLVIPVIDGVPVPFEQEDIDAGRVLALPYPITDIIPSPFPLEISLSPSVLLDLSEGPHELAYWIINDQARNVDDSPVQTFTLDWTPPSNTRVPLALQVPVPAPPIENGQPVFDRAYLTANDPVVFPVPGYTTARAGDQIRLIDGANGAEILPWTVLWPEANAVAPTREIPLPASVLEGLLGDGRQLRYQLRDRPGNESGLSSQLNFIVRLQEDPANLAAPVIASPINRATLFPVTNRVAVTIPDNPSLLDDDLITVTWVDGAGTPRSLLPFRYADRQTHVDWAFLSTPDSRARYTASVTYTVQRVGRPNPFGPSPAATPQVDLSIVGPVNPNEPDPINQTLTLLIVQGGSGTSPDNFITPADAVKAVKEESKIIFPMYTGAVAGHHVTIFYGTAQITTLTLDASHIGEPTLEFNLPWTTIQAQGNGVILAYYEIRGVAGAANVQRSRNTDVTVSAITLLMRNFVWFDSSRSALSIPNARQNQRRGTATTRTGVINCGIQPWNGVNLILRNVRPTDPVNLSRGTVTASMTAAVTAADLAVTQGTGTPAQAALEASAAAIRAAQAAAGTPTEVSLVADAETASAEAATQAVGTPAQLQATRAATHAVYASRALVDAVAEEGGGGIPSVAISPGDILTVYWEYHAGESLGQAVPAPVERVLHSMTVPANYDPVAGVNYQVAYEDILFGQTQNPPPPTGAASIVCRFSIRRGVEVWISSPCLVKYNTTQNGLICRDWGSTARS